MKAILRDGGEALAETGCGPAPPAGAGAVARPPAAAATNSVSFPP